MTDIELCKRRLLRAEKLLRLILDSQTLEMELQAKVRHFLEQV